SSHRLRHPLGRGAELLVGDVRENVLPDRQRHPGSLDHPEWPRQEPDVEVGAAVAPAVEVDARDVAEGEDRALDAGGNAAEIGLEPLRQVAERVDVATAREPDGSGQAAADGRVQCPVLVRPDGRGRLAAADPAGRAARLAAAWRLRDLARAGLARDERLLV